MFNFLFSVLQLLNCDIEENEVIWDANAFFTKLTMQRDVLAGHWKDLGAIMDRMRLHNSCIDHKKNLELAMHRGTQLCNMLPKVCSHAYISNCSNAI